MTVYVEIMKNDNYRYEQGNGEEIQGGQHHLGIVLQERKERKGHWSGVPTSA
jgi:hypothetical protein